MSITLDIGLDVDDVLFPWSQRAHAACEVAGITNGKVITQWAAYADYGCTREEFWGVVTSAYKNGMLDEPPFDYVVADLLLLKSHNHRIHLVTARGFEGPLAGFVRERTHAWVQQIPHDTLTFASDKRSVPTDYFLDDAPHNVLPLREAGVEAYLHDQPHNQSAQGIPRVTNLSVFVELVLSEAHAMNN